MIIIIGEWAEKKVSTKPNKLSAQKFIPRNEKYSIVTISVSDESGEC